MKILLFGLIYIITSLSTFAVDDNTTCYGVSIYLFEKSRSDDEKLFEKPQNEMMEYIKENYKTIAKKVLFQTVIFSKGNNEGISTIESLKAHDIPDEMKSRVDSDKLKPVGIKSIISLQKQKKSDSLAISIEYSKNHFEVFTKNYEQPLLENAKNSESDGLLIPYYTNNLINTTLSVKPNEIYFLGGVYSTDALNNLKHVHYMFLTIEEIPL